MINMESCVEHSDIKHTHRWLYYEATPHGGYHTHTHPHMKMAVKRYTEEGNDTHTHMCRLMKPDPDTG